MILFILCVSGAIYFYYNYQFWTHLDTEDFSSLREYRSKNIKGLRGRQILVHKNFMPFMENLERYAKTNDVKLIINQSYRDNSKVLSRSVVNQARFSNHLAGHAIDFNLLHKRTKYFSHDLNRDNLQNLPENIQTFINNVRKDKNLRWGGDFRNEDPIHIDNPLNITSRKEWSIYSEACHNDYSKGSQKWKSRLKSMAEYYSIHPIRSFAILMTSMLILASILFFLKRNYSIKGFNVIISVGLGVIVLTILTFLLIQAKSTFKLKPNAEYVFGIDFSAYQKRVDWEKVNISHHPIEFIIIRSTMGIDGKDKQFLQNWRNAKSNRYIRGAYHYYRPHENSTDQFNNYAATVHLLSGDIPPILDIEKESRYGKEELRQGVLNWLKLAEDHYSVKPIVYTGRNFYKSWLKGHVDDYPLWIASYSPKRKLRRIDWKFHQFSDKVTVQGINGNVDGNDFNGTFEELQELLIK